MATVSSPSLVRRWKHSLKTLGHRASLQWSSLGATDTDLRPIFIVSQPRTGSTLLQNLLNSVPGVSMTGEVFSTTLPIGLGAEARPRPAALRHVRKSLLHLKSRHCGAKFLIDQMDIHGVSIADLHATFPEAVFLILYRASLLEQFVSFRVARATGQWVGASGNRSQFDGRLRIDVDELTRHCRREREKYARILDEACLSRRSVVVGYEEVAASPQAVFDRDVFPLLGLESSAVTTEMSKQIKRDMNDLIENYAEIESKLDGFRLSLSRSGHPTAQTADREVVLG